jgi:hypothetical protein
MSHGADRKLPGTGGACFSLPGGFVISRHSRGQKEKSSRRDNVPRNSDLGSAREFAEVSNWRSFERFGPSGRWGSCGPGFVWCSRPEESSSPRLGGLGILRLAGAKRGTMAAVSCWFKEALLVLEPETDPAFDQPNSPG